MSLNLRSIKTQTAALVFAVFVVAPPIPHAAPRGDAHAAAADLSIAGIDNLGCVNPAYYRGGEPSGQAYANLAELGIRTIVDLRGPDGNPREQGLVEQAGMKYFHIPMTTRDTPSDAQVSAFLRIVTDPANQPVYVHCVGGRHRTGVMTAVYRMTQDGWTADRAFKEMQNYKFGPAFLHPEFKKFVYEYDSAASAARKAAQ